MQRRDLITGLGVMGLALTGCATPPPEEAAAFEEQVSGTRRPTGPDRLAMTGRLVHYWAALQAARYREAYAFLTPDYQDNLPFAQFRSAHPPLPYRRQIRKLHWLKDSPRMPGPELFCVVLWEAGPPGGQYARGELVWRQEDDGRFYVQSSETKVA